MSLYDANARNRQDKKTKKIKQMIIVSIIILIIIIIVLIMLMVYLSIKPKKMSLQLDDKQNDELLSLLDIEVDEEGNMNMYAPIKLVASYFNYEANNGSYPTASENTDMCNVKNTNEVAVFTADSNEITVIDLLNRNANSEKITIDEKVIKEGDQLYTTKQGLEKAFHITIDYDPNNNVISIYTLDTYIAALTKQDAQGKTVIENYGYAMLDENYKNQHAIIDDMVVVVTEQGKYGVISYSTGESILGTQYDNIEYLQQSSAFLVKTNQKSGIIDKDGNTKIQPIYDTLEQIDSKRQLYLASVNKLYGIVNKIGVDIKQYDENNITNGYILADTLIPVCQGTTWGFFDINGKQITGLIYTNIGCITQSSQGTFHNVLIIPNYNIIIVSKNGLYGGINLQGKEELSMIYNSIYMQTISGQNYYYGSRTLNGETRTRDLSKYLQEL